MTKKIIKVEINKSKPVLNLLIEALNDFLTELLDDIPSTYYIDVEVGNNHPQIVTLPLKKLFKARGPPIIIDGCKKQGSSK